MKILMLTPYLPYPLLSGGQIRTYNLLKQLAAKHDVTLFALIKDEGERRFIKDIEPYCESIRVFKRSEKPFTLGNILRTGFSKYPFLVMRNHVSSMMGEIQKQLETEKYDLIHAETFYMMPHLPETSVPVLLVEQTIEYLGYESYAQKAAVLLKPLLYLDIRKIKHWEQHYWNTCQKLVVMSEDDKRLVSPMIHQPSKIEVVANGVDIQWFAQKRRSSSQPPTVLFVGTFKWLPNREAVDFLVNKIWPLIREKIPNAVLKIVGNAPTVQIEQLAESKNGITVAGGIPDIRDAFVNADVLIAPVFSGKGTRYKVLESLAAGTAVVATPTAVEGLRVKNGVHVSVANDANSLAKETIKLLKDKDLRVHLANNGRRYVSENYDWSLISKKLDNIYQTMGEK